MRPSASTLLCILLLGYVVAAVYAAAPYTGLWNGTNLNSLFRLEYYLIGYGSLIMIVVTVIVPFYLAYLVGRNSRSISQKISTSELEDHPLTDEYLT